MFQSYIAPANPLQTLFDNTNMESGGAKLYKDEIFDTVTTSGTTKIPIKLSLASAGTSLAMLGNIMYDRTTDAFYGHTTAGWTLISNSGSAPASGSYLTVTSEAGLTNERILTAGTGITFVDGGPGGAFTISSSSTYTRTTVNNAASPYSALETDDIIAVDTSAGPVTINLPSIAGLTTPSNHKEYTIVDEGGNAGTNNITIAAFAGDTIIGDTQIILSADYNAVKIYSDGTSGWFIR